MRLALFWIVLSWSGGSNGFAQLSDRIEEVSPTLLRLGNIKIDKAANAASFQATINMRSGALEYFLVDETGKTHESLFVTKVDPAQLHVAMLLLGAKAPIETDKMPPTQIDSSYLKSAPKLEGSNVEIVVSWKEDGKPVKARAEELVLKKKEAIKTGPWTYNGSLIFEGRFLAQAEGSIVALVTDPVALINNPRLGADDDQIWSPRTGKLPPQDVPVEITFKLLPN